MTKVRSRYVRLLLGTIALVAGRAEALSLASVFSDNMVLQRGRPVPIWGTADPGAMVEVDFCGQQASAIADAAGTWSATLDRLTASVDGKSLVVRSGNDTISIDNVLVGDVWLCSGQSNMQMPLKDTDGGKKFAEEHGDNPRMRLLMVPKKFTASPQDAQDGKWELATPESASQFSAVGFSFGALLADSPALKDVPIGLIDSSFGGTTAEGWISAAELATFDKDELGNSMFGQPTEHYNAMIRPLVPLAIRGVVWYQGESNSDRPAIYGSLLDTLIASWRRDFQSPNLPFIVIQLPAYNQPFQRNYFTWIREQQANVARQTAGVSLVVTYDTHDGSDLHPREKLLIGKRAADSARAEVYGEALPASGPQYAQHRVDGDKVHIDFDTHGEKLRTTDGGRSVRGFQLAASDGDFKFARGAIVDDDTVVVSSPRVAAPREIRFAWGGVPDANLVSTANLPAAPFRTDDLPPESAEFVHVPTSRAIKTPYYEAEIDATGSLRSFGVRGEQFISNELGANGGSCIPTFFGPRSLNQVEEVGPRELVFSDAEASVRYRFSARGVMIIVQNNTANEIEFQIAVAAEVEDKGNSGNVLRKRSARLIATGFGRVEPATETVRLKVSIPAGTSRDVEFVVRDSE